MSSTLALQARRHGGDGRGRLRFRAHGEDVAQRVIGGDAAEQPGIVDEGAEEIDAYAPSPCPAARAARRHRPARAGRSARRRARSAGCSASARDSTVAPTLAPQPPQRMATAEIACVCSPRRSGTASPAGRATSAMAGNSVNLRMKRRSIQSFQRQTSRRARRSAPREATACLSPVLISASQRRCGR